jgi:hypothetical protein
MTAKVKRREFIAVLGSAPAMWPFVVRAQIAAVRTIGYMAPPQRPDWLAGPAEFEPLHFASAGTRP